MNKKTWVIICVVVVVLIAILLLTTGNGDTNTGDHGFLFMHPSLWKSITLSFQHIAAGRFIGMIVCLGIFVFLFYNMIVGNYDGKKTAAMFAAVIFFFAFLFTRAYQVQRDTHVDVTQEQYDNRTMLDLDDIDSYLKHPGECWDYSTGSFYTAANPIRPSQDFIDFKSGKKK